MDLEFAGWLKRRRRVLDLTQEDLAERSFCSVHSIRKIESGDLMPSKALAIALARALDVPAEADDDFVHFARTVGTTASEDAFRANAIPTASAPRPTAPPQTAVRFHVPLPLTAVLGREHDTGVITRVLRLPATRIVTLTGPPGTGKTRLSLEVANELAESMAYGAAFVALAPLAQAEQVENAIAQVLNVRETGQTTLTTALRTFLRDKELLLVLDNFEHVLEATGLVGELLRSAPKLKILATSREPLRIYGEREVPVMPLALPSLTPLPPPGELENVSAVRLFVERAQQLKPDFELSAHNAESVARLCVGLDGLPLAIEMAAARVKWETPQTLLAQWQQRTIHLEFRARDRDARQQTLRGAMDWSYERLDAAEQRVFRQLGIFRGGFTAAAANAVSALDVEPYLQALVEKSLVKLEQGADERARYDLLEMIRAYALEQLTRADEAVTAQERHAAFYRARAHAISYAREYGTGGAWEHFDVRDAENFRLALEWYADHDRVGAVELASDLHDLWVDKGFTREGRDWMARLVPASDGSPVYVRGLTEMASLSMALGDFPSAAALAERARQLAEPDKSSPLYGRSLQLLGYVALMRGDYVGADELSRAARAEYQQLGLRSHEARVLNNLGLIAKDRGKLQEAEEYHQAALARRRELRLQSDITQSLFNLAIVAYWSADYPKAIGIGTEAYEQYLADGDAVGASYVMETVGMAQFKLGQHQAAADALETSIAFLRRMDDKRGLALLLNALGDVALAQGEYARARACHAEALQHCRDTGEKRRAAFCFEGFAAAIQPSGESARAATLLGAADALRQAIGAPLYAADRPPYDALLAQVRATLSQQEFDGAWRAGQALSMEEAIELALQTKDE